MKRFINIQLLILLSDVDKKLDQLKILKWVPIFCIFQFLFT